MLTSKPSESCVQWVMNNLSKVKEAKMNRIECLSQGKIEGKPNEYFKERVGEMICNSCEYLLPSKHFLDDSGSVPENSKLFYVVLQNVPILCDMKHI